MKKTNLVIIFLIGFLALFSGCVTIDNSAEELEIDSGAADSGQGSVENEVENTIDDELLSEDDDVEIGDLI